jgi:hypothetical protein
MHAISDDKHKNAHALALTTCLHAEYSTSNHFVLFQETQVKTLQPEVYTLMRADTLSYTS